MDAVGCGMSRYVRDPIGKGFVAGHHGVHAVGIFDEGPLKPHLDWNAYYIACAVCCTRHSRPRAGVLECAAHPARREARSMGEHTIREILKRRSPETQRAMQRRRDLASGGSAKKA